jgi:SAM-dependent methyltransferase
LEESKHIEPRRCPLCGVDTNYVYCIEDGRKGHEGEKSVWYRCQCGILFQEELPSNDIYDDKYIVNLADAKQAKDRYGYYIRTYAPLIEDITYGRMMLEVGFCAPYILKNMEERGWLTWGIDINPALTGKGNLYKGDFVTYDFALPVNDPVLAKEIGPTVQRTFDLIWMGHTLEHFENPIAALDKAYNLLDPKGVIFISTPDIDFINKTGVGGWPHFTKKEHYILWSEGALKRELERLGFKIIMCRRNFSSRFMSWYDIHCIAQKSYF